MNSPPPLACLSCGYDVAGLDDDAPRCPECGVALAEQSRASMARLRAILDRGDAMPWKHVIAWALVVFIYAAGAEFMRGEDDIPALIIATVMLSIVCFGSLALGSVALLGLERPMRLAAQHAWRSELWLLHIPWLLMAPAAALLLAAIYAFMAAGLGLESTLWALGVVALVWLPCCLAAPFVFMRRVRRRLRETGADRRMIRLRLLVAALVVLGFAMFMGFGGGLLARYGAATMAGYGDPPPDGF